MFQYLQILFDSMAQSPAAARGPFVPPPKPSVQAIPIAGPMGRGMRTEGWKSTYALEAALIYGLDVLEQIMLSSLSNSQRTLEYF